MRGQATRRSNAPTAMAHNRSGTDGSAAAMAGGKRWKSKVYHIETQNGSAACALLPLFRNKKSFDCRQALSMTLHVFAGLTATMTWLGRVKTPSCVQLRCPMLFTVAPAASPLIIQAQLQQ